MRAPDFWTAPPGLAAGLLTPFGVAWGAASRLRRAVTRVHRAPVPVVCVGNLTAGGTGKTPVVLALAALVRGRTVHVVTRGYGGRTVGPLAVDPASHDAVAVGDEALLIAARAPCWVAHDRAAGVRAAAEAGAKVILLDDGFQNWGIDKNLSLIVVDAAYGFGNRRLIPAGPLREPAAPGLARADAVVLIGDGPVPEEVAHSRLPVLRAALAPVGAARFAGMRVVAFAGIGRPGKFFATLRSVGAEVVEAHAFPDHHRFGEAELARLHRQTTATGALLVTTAKDWVRLPPLSRPGIDVLEVELRWEDQAVVLQLLSAVLPQLSDGCN